ncbi:MAG: hypothetical protein K6T81_16310 [Alicyclobacillus macrosporangiidus]|uniref:hypothetical protein n=1 Tax=Alicyclobacillus macrosporangiidus TaxID=392015 RepID=UPI0026EF7172|nr:hypothetical protein [Alicyclobacillus macrosporangiidus]MCL6600280.1 hypothetical protein [Alicyclobacillus macrosporangiidus]
MASSAAAAAIPDLTQTMSKLGFRPVNPWSLMGNVTMSFATLIQVVFSWVFFFSEIAVLIGALVYIAGAIGSHSRIKRVGAHMVLYAIVGFAASVILPGVIVAINNNFHG